MICTYVCRYCILIFHFTKNIKKSIKIIVYFERYLLGMLACVVEAFVDDISVVDVKGVDNA